MNTLKVNQLTIAVLERLEDMKEIFDVEVEKGGGSYSDTEFTMKIKFKDVGAKSQLEIDYEEMAEWNKFKPLGTEVTFNRGTVAKIVGYDRKKRKYPIIAETADGKRYKLPESYAKEAA